MAKIADQSVYRQFSSPKETSKYIMMLKGLILGIKSDHIINESEILELKNWCLVCKPYYQCNPFKDFIIKINEILEDNFITKEEYDDLLWLCELYSERHSSYDLLTSTIQTLHGRLYGYLADGFLVDEEIKDLEKWITDNSFLNGTYPYDELKSVLTTILEDGIITEHEREYLIACISSFVDTSVSYNLCNNEFEELRSKYCVSGICTKNPEIIIQNNVFCFTGESSKTTRSEIAKQINSLGGIFNNNVINDTNYLVIGNNSSPCWAFACYGRKVEKAMELRKKGLSLLIVHENDFWNSLQSI